VLIYQPKCGWHQYLSLSRVRYILDNDPEGKEIEFDRVGFHFIVHGEDEAGKMSRL
jgi:hypothetical protein